MSGFIGNHRPIELLNAGYPARGTVQPQERAAGFFGTLDPKVV